MNANSFSSSTGKADTLDVYSHVGQQLRSLRMDKRLTQAEVARIIDVSPQQYQKYEDAQSKCSLPYLLKLAEFYSVQIESLLPRNEQVETVEEAPPQSVEAAMPLEADLLTRLISSFVKLSDMDEKLRLVQLVEAIVSAERK